MALTRLHKFKDDEVPTAADLNAEFNNIVAKFNSNITAGDLNPTAFPTSERYVDASKYASIRAAVESAAAAGLGVWLPANANPYTGDENPILLPDGMEVIGAGPGKTTIKPTSGYAHVAFFVVGGSNVRLAGFTLVEPDSYNVNLEEFRGIQAVYGSGLTEHQGLIIENITFDFDTTTPAGLMKHCVYIGGAGIGMTVQHCKFLMDDPNGVVSRGVVFGACSIRVTGCQFTNGLHQIYNNNDAYYGGRAIITDCVFTPGIYTQANIRLNSGGLIQGCLFYSNASGSYAQAEHIRLFSDIRDSVYINSNIFYNANSHPHYAVYSQGSIINLSHNAFLGATNYTALVYGETENTRVYHYANNIGSNTMAAGTPRIDAARLFGFSYDSNDLLKLGDTYVWLYLRSTDSKYYMCFRQGSLPTVGGLNTTNGAQAYIKLSGSL